MSKSPASWCAAPLAHRWDHLLEGFGIWIRHKATLSSLFFNVRECSNTETRIKSSTTTSKSDRIAVVLLAFFLLLLLLPHLKADENEAKDQDDYHNY